MLNKKSCSGFTLLEILVALFIFTIVSTMLAAVLHSTIATQISFEKNAVAFSKLQMTMLIMQQDFAQITSSLSGSSQDIRFTKASLSSPLDNPQIIRYFLQNQHWVREASYRQRKLLNHVMKVNFQYIDEHNKTYDNWPPTEQTSAALPKAIRITIFLQSLGRISQLYVIE